MAEKAIYDSNGSVFVSTSSPIDANPERLRRPTVPVHGIEFFQKMVGKKRRIIWSVTIVFYMVEKVGEQPNGTLSDILLFYIGGSGFQNVEYTAWSVDRMTSARALATKWLKSRSAQQMFQFVFDQNGVQCKEVLGTLFLSHVEVEIFESCFIDRNQFDCCSYFQPHYVLLRGKCLRLEKFNLRPFTHLVINFRKPKGELISHEPQRQYAVHVSDSFAAVATFPRFYLTFNDKIFMNVYLRKVLMRPDKRVCSFAPKEQGRATCYINKWLQDVVISRFNCTFVYLSNFSSSAGFETCDPSIIVTNYDGVVNGGFNNTCLLNCHREDYTWKAWTHVIRDGKTFSIDITFPDNYYEIYEERVMTTLPGFISQLGGQLNLYLGISVISLLNAGVYVKDRICKNK
ncbi:unnamed protein product [Caenorhabditis auriculariae]|uniref:Uncharacterized protein n=1 Tax=Caenorhabditis auriculariae TaxID=2777116 RepID=A0A8S1GX38_9PELO|nr:unnamed protein product [Caenorhabditis auriculariae]